MSSHLLLLLLHLTPALAAAPPPATPSESVNWFLPITPTPTAVRPSSPAPTHTHNHSNHSNHSPLTVAFACLLPLLALAALIGVWYMRRHPPPPPAPSLPTTSLPITSTTTFLLRASPRASWSDSISGTTLVKVRSPSPVYGMHARCSTAATLASSATDLLGGVSQHLMQQQQGYPPPFPVTPTHVYFPEEGARRVSTVISEDEDEEEEGVREDGQKGEEEEGVRLVVGNGFDDSLLDDVMATLNLPDGGAAGQPIRSGEEGEGEDDHPDALDAQIGELLELDPDSAAVRIADIMAAGGGRSEDPVSLSRATSAVYEPVEYGIALTSSWVAGPGARSPIAGRASWGGTRKQKARLVNFVRRKTNEGL